MSEIIGISATELERLSVLALSGTPALQAGQVYDVDGQRYRWTGTAWEKRWRSQWLPVRAETNESGEVVRVAASTIDLPVVTYQTSPGGGIGELQLGGRRVAVAALDTPVVLIGGDHPYPQLWGTNGRNGLAGLYASRGIVPYVAVNTNSQTGEGVGQGSMLSWDRLKQLESWGMIELGSHGVRHYQDWTSPDAGLHVKYTGNAATATMHVTSTGVVGTTAGNVHDFAFDFATYPTLGELSAAIDALPNWTSSYSTELSGSESSAMMLTVADTNAKSCIAASTYGTNFSMAGGIRIFWDTAVTPAQNVFAYLTATSLNIIRDGMRVASISLSAHTMSSLLAAVRAVNPALASTDQNGKYFTALCNDMGAVGRAYMTGEEAALNLGRGVKYSYKFDCLRQPCVLPAGGLSAAYLRRRNAVGARVAAQAAGTDLPTFIQSGSNFFASHAAELAGDYEQFRGNSRWDIIEPKPTPITLTANGFHTHISTKNNYNSTEAIDGLVDGIIASRGHVVDLLIHAITSDAVPDDGTVPGSSGYYLRTAGAGADMTEAPFVYLLDRLRAAANAGKIRIVQQRDLNQVARISLPTKNLIYNPTLRARPGADLKITDNWGRLVSGWKLDGFSLPAISQIDGGIEFTSAGSLRTVLTQRVIVERGKRYRIGARVETDGGTNVYGCRFCVASVRGDWPDQVAGQTLSKISSEILTGPYNDLTFDFTVPTPRGRGFAKIVSLNAQPWNLSTNKNVKLTVPGFTAFDIDCSVGAASASAVTAKEVAAAINAGVAANAAFAAHSDLHTMARAENGRVVIEFPRIAEYGYGSAGELKVAAGTTASATNTIFGANDGFAWPDAAGANDMTWFPVDVQFAINGVAGTKFRVRDLWMQAIPDSL